MGNLFIGTGWKNQLAHPIHPPHWIPSTQYARRHRSNYHLVTDCIVCGIRRRQVGKTYEGYLMLIRSTLRASILTQFISLFLLHTIYFLFPSFLSTLLILIYFPAVPWKRPVPVFQPSLEGSSSSLIRPQPIIFPEFPLLIDILTPLSDSIYCVSVNSFILTSTVRKILRQVGRPPPLLYLDP